jgi:F0F1-type ATP synthase membrane subunit a
MQYGCQTILASEQPVITDVIAMLLSSTMINRLLEISSGTTSKLYTCQCIQLDVSVVVHIHTMSALLETVSVGFRSVSLGARFLANISAGHLVGHLLAGQANSDHTVRGTLLHTVCFIVLQSMEAPVSVLIQPTVYGSLILVYAGI